MKYKPHRRYREPAVVEAPKKPRIKLQPSPRASNVRRARIAVTRLVRKFGTKRYKKHRRKTTRIVEKALVKYHLKDTSSEMYWRLALTCILIGQ
jgi:hypothetical protein